MPHPLPNRDARYSNVVKKYRDTGFETTKKCTGNYNAEKGSCTCLSGVLSYTSDFFVKFLTLNRLIIERSSVSTEHISE